MENFCWELFEKINRSLLKNKISKGAVAKELKISNTAFSNRLKNLKNGKGIDVITIKVIENLTGETFFCFENTENQYKD